MALKKRTVFFLFFSLLLLSVWLLFPEVRAKAGGLIEEAVGATGSLYDKYALDAYELDFWVDEGFSLDLGEKISGGLSYMVYQITLAIWGFVRALGYFAGQLVQEAYEMDFIGGTVTEVSASMQRLAGIGSGGLMSRGLIPSFLPLLVLVMGAYVAYVAVVKFQASKALRTVLAFVLVGVLGMGMIAGAGQYLGMLNDFQKEFNQEVLAVTDTVAGEEGGTQGIRDNLFSILVYEPYLLLQYGTTDVDAIGQERIDSLLSAKFGSEERREIAKTEAQDLENENISASRAAGRLGTALLVFLLDLVIIVCVALFCAVMIFSQVLFSLYAMFLPVAFLFALLPGSMGNFTRSLERVFGCVLRKAGITVILSVVFSLSSMAYSLAATKGFLWVVFLQIVIYVGAFLKCSELLSFMRVGTSGEERAAGRLQRRASMLLQTVVLRKAFSRHGHRSSGHSKGTEQMVAQGTEASARPRKDERVMAEGVSFGRGFPAVSDPSSHSFSGGDQEGAGGSSGGLDVTALSWHKKDLSHAEGNMSHTEGDPSHVKGQEGRTQSSGAQGRTDPSSRSLETGENAATSKRKRRKRSYEGAYEGSPGSHEQSGQASGMSQERLEEDRAQAGRPFAGQEQRKKDYGSSSADAPSVSSNVSASVSDKVQKRTRERLSVSPASGDRKMTAAAPSSMRMQEGIKEGMKEEALGTVPKAAPAVADRKKDFENLKPEREARTENIERIERKEAPANRTRPVAVAKVEGTPDASSLEAVRPRIAGYKKGGVKAATKFNNFDEREYADMDALENMLLEASVRPRKGADMWPDGAKR